MLFSKFHLKRDVGMTSIALVIYYLIYLSFMFTFGSFLAAKAIKKRFINVLYFAIAFLVNGCFFALKFANAIATFTFFQNGVSEAVYLATLLPGIVFIKKSFYAGKKSPLIVILAWILYIVCAAISIIAGFLNDLDQTNNIFKITRYIIDDLVIFPLIFTWNAVNGLRAYKRPASFSSRITRLRFVFFAAGNIAAVVSYVLDYVSGIPFPELLTFYLPVSVSCASLYGILMYITWFPPARMAMAVQYSGRILRSTSPTAEDRAQRSRFQEAVAGQTLARATTMAVIEHFGNILAATIGQSPAACSGLLLTTIESDLGPDAMFHLSIHDLEHVIGTSLKARLEALGVENLALAIDTLHQELEANTSSLTWAMF